MIYSLPRSHHPQLARCFQSRLLSYSTHFFSFSNYIINTLFCQVIFRFIFYLYYTFFTVFSILQLYYQSDSDFSFLSLLNISLHLNIIALIVLKPLNLRTYAVVVQCFNIDKTFHYTYFLNTNKYLYMRLNNFSHFLCYFRNSINIRMYHIGRHI